MAQVDSTLVVRLSTGALWSIDSATLTLGSLISASHGYGPACVAISSSLSQYAVCSDDGTVCIRVISSAQPHSELKFRHAPKCVKFSPADDGVILAGFDDGTICGISRNGKLLFKQKAHSSTVRVLAISSDGKHSLSFADDGYLLRCEISATGLVPISYYQPTSSIHTLSWPKVDENVTAVLQDGSMISFIFPGSAKTSENIAHFNSSDIQLKTIDLSLCFGNSEMFITIAINISKSILIVVARLIAGNSEVRIVYLNDMQKNIVLWRENGVDVTDLSLSSTQRTLIVCDSGGGVSTLLFPESIKQSADTLSLENVTLWSAGAHNAGKTSAVVLDNDAFILSHNADGGSFLWKNTLTPSSVTFDPRINADEIVASVLIEDDERNSAYSFIEATERSRKNQEEESHLAIQRNIKANLIALKERYAKLSDLTIAQRRTVSINSATVLHHRMLSRCQYLIFLENTLAQVKQSMEADALKSSKGVRDEIQNISNRFTKNVIANSQEVSCISVCLSHIVLFNNSRTQRP